MGTPAHTTNGHKGLSTLNLDITGVECTASLSGRFTPGKEHRYTLKSWLDGSPSRYGRLGAQKNPLSTLVMGLFLVA